MPVLMVNPKYWTAPCDGEAVVAPEHVAAPARVVVTADFGEFQDLEVAVDGPLGRTQGGG